MEFVLVLFLGMWISAAGVCGYLWIKKEMAPFLEHSTDKEDITK